jgi:phage terminase large subunit
VRETVKLGYEARAEFVPFHMRTERWACLVAHRRAGKTVACVADVVDAALRCEKPDPRFAYVAPLYVQAKDVAWAYLKRFTAPIPGVEFNESELRADFPVANGIARVRLYGADNYDRMRGVYLDGAILDEYADMPPAAWGEVIRPALADRQGWAVFIGTPKGRNAFWEKWEQAKADPAWFHLMLKASDTGLLPATELEAARRDMTPEQYEQEFECSFEAAILGAYYGKEIAEAERSGRITEVAHDPALPVHTAWDLGISDSTAIWFFQMAGGEIRVIDFYENHGQPLAHYASVLASKPHRYEHDWVPHDAKVRELGTGRTRIETLISLNRRPRLVPDHDVEDGINAARLTIPRVWFDVTNCRDGIEALRQYRTEFDEKKRAFKKTPRHDWTSHTADAFRYLAMAWREMVPQPVKPAGKVLTIGMPATNQVTLNDLWSAQKKRSSRI